MRHEDDQCATDIEQMETTFLHNYYLYGMKWNVTPNER